MKPAVRFESLERPPVVREVSVGRFMVALPRQGINLALQNFARQGEHPDVIQFQAPLCRDVAVITSHDALIDVYRAGASCPFDRHSVLASTGAGDLMSYPDNPDSGIALSKASDTQKSRNMEIRESFDGVNPEVLATRSVELVTDGLLLGRSVEESLVQAIRVTVLRAITGDENYPVDPLHELSRRRLTGVVLSSIIRPEIARVLLTKGMDGVEFFSAHNKQVYQQIASKNGRNLSGSDIAELYATTPAIVSSAYWLVDSILSTPRGERALINARDYALEALRIGGSFTISPPRESIIGSGESELTLISPSVILRDARVIGSCPYQFDANRYAGDDGDKMRKRVLSTAFGYGAHHCPASGFTMEYLESLAEQLAQSHMLVRPGDMRRANVFHLNGFLPSKKHQAKLC